jgi:cytochrome c oxidase cbb3-type subunit 3
VRWPAEAAAAVSFAITPEAVAAGEAVYTQNCAMCHGAELEGGIGTPLNDAEWIHGGDSETVLRIITEGVPEKGMLTWGPILGPEKINQVAAYVLDRNADYVGEVESPEEAGEVENSEKAGEEDAPAE